MLSAPISFSTELCVLGPFLVATTPTGICAVLFGEDTVALEDDLAQRFASATRIRLVFHPIPAHLALRSGQHHIGAKMPIGFSSSRWPR